MKKNANPLSFTCRKCGKEIEPLLRYDGTMWCPKCHHDLFEGMQVTTEDAEGHFALSQEYFARYLMQDSSPMARQYIDNAIAFCRKSAYNGNAYALLNLGYYYSCGYVASVQPEAGRAFAKTCYERAESAGDKGIQEMAAAKLKDDVRSADMPVGVAYINALCARVRATTDSDSRVPRLGIFYVGRDGKDKDLERALKDLAKALGGNDTLFYLTQDGDKYGEMAVYHKASALDINDSNRDRVRSRYWGYRNRNYQGVNKAYRRIVRREIENRSEVQQCLDNVRITLGEHHERAMDFFDDDVVISAYNYRTERRDANINSALDVLYKQFKEYKEENNHGD